jgi:hypothetical protein
MKRLMYYLLMAGILVGFVLAVGCSKDDDKGTTPATPGDPDDPLFLIVSDVLGDGLMSNDGAIIDLAMELSNQIPGKAGFYNPFKPQAPNQFDSISYTYSYSNYWHIFSLLAIQTEWNGVSYDSMIYTGVDSLRFSNPSGPMQYPDSTTTTLAIRAHIDVEITTANTDVKISPAGAHAMISTDASYTITGQPDVALYINGTSANSLIASLVGDTIGCDITLTANQTVTNLYLDSLALGDQGGCPRSGTLRIVSSLDLYCEGETDTLDAQGVWTVLLTFEDGMVNVHVSNATNYWDEDEQCGPTGTTKSGWSSILNRFTEPLRQE